MNWDNADQKLVIFCLLRKHNWLTPVKCIWCYILRILTALWGLSVSTTWRWLESSSEFVILEWRDEEEATLTCNPFASSSLFTDFSSLPLQSLTEDGLSSLFSHLMSFSLLWFSVSSSLVASTVPGTLGPSWTPSREHLFSFWLDVCILKLNRRLNFEPY